MFVQGIGARQQIRGKVKGASRPTLVIADDIYSEETVITEESRAKIKRWWNNAVMNSIDNVKGKVVDVEETFDTGKSWVEGNRLYNQWANLYGGLEDCFPIYNNPEGMPEKKDEYIGVAVYGFVPFSIVD